jgi:malate dehydrogenase (oxaloacetate-decarboxylating)
VLVFPGVFRGLLDAHVGELTTAAQLAAARAIARTVGEDALRPEHIVPSVFDEALVPAVAHAVAAETGAPG